MVDIMEYISYSHFSGFYTARMCQNCQGTPVLLHPLSKINCMLGTFPKINYITLFPSIVVCFGLPVPFCGCGIIVKRREGIFISEKQRAL